MLRACLHVFLHRLRGWRFAFSSRVSQLSVGSGLQIWTSEVIESRTFGEIKRRTKDQYSNILEISKASKFVYLWGWRTLKAPERNQTLCYSKLFYEVVIQSLYRTKSSSLAFRIRQILNKTWTHEYHFRTELFFRRKVDEILTENICPIGNAFLNMSETLTQSGLADRSFESQKIWRTVEKPL